LFIRSYLALAGGLLVAAIVLDLAFGALQAREARNADPWLESTFRLVEARLASAAIERREAEVVRISQDLGVDVRLLDAADISAAPTSRLEGRALVDAAGQTYYLRSSPRLGVMVRMGPVPKTRTNALFRWVPIAFYLSILIVVGLWLRPLLADLRVLTDASQRFAADYREPLTTASKTTQLTTLARHLDDMSARISHMIQSQKELTAALSHEMRTPLARIRFALAVIGNQTDSGVQTQLRDVNQDVQQIDDLIASMLHYARLDHPGLKMEWQDTAIESWLQHAMAASAAPDRDVELIRSPAFERAWMDPRLMELALSNLIVNACRYSKRRVAVTLSGVDAYRIIVEDDGEGIPAGGRESIFKAFTRLDTSRNRDTGGFGLGLAIVTRIATLHGGRISADISERLRGAKLTLEWPRPASGAG
jgi:signal transduction histidine kinase